MNILITGCNGYIGSSLYLFLKKKYNILGIDKKDHPLKPFKYYKFDLLNKRKLNNFFKNKKIDLVIHLAGQSTIDNISKKKLYYKNNVIVTKNLVEASKNYGVKNLIFSSTAAVYKKKNAKLNEKSEIRPNNIYGITKFNSEKIIQNKFKGNFVIFRFFNVCSSLTEFNIGEAHNPETHLIPIIVNKLLNKKNIKIYGKNYKTKDGTCIRDYIHIRDLCIAHYKVIKIMKKKIIRDVINLGNQQGQSVMEILKISKTIAKKNYLKEHEFVKKRKGDIAKLVANSLKAKKIINWKAKYSNIKRILFDEFKWQKSLKYRKLLINTIY